MSDRTVREALADIGKDLFAIEVNTIIKHTMTASRFPGVAHAIIDIADDYDCFLATSFVPFEGGVRVEGKAKTRVVDWSYFDGLRVYAKWLLENGFQDDTQMRRRLLKRVIDNSDEIKSILARNGHGSAEPGFTRQLVIDRSLTKDPVLGKIGSADLVIVRKVWEIGLEIIAMQTVIQLDGDVVTRIQPEFAAGGAPGLFALHEQTTRVALGFWKDLVQVASEVVKATLGVRRG